MNSWVRYSVAVYLGLLLAGSLVPLERWTSLRDAWSNPPPDSAGRDDGILPPQQRRAPAAAAPDNDETAAAMTKLEAEDQLARAAGMRNDVPRGTSLSATDWTAADASNEPRDPQGP
ncbi:MAG: hypothetical protein NTW19_08365 [Planctomycetota bacterium]|nr:hypothetical protein [Planctomycetota bacterium]